MSQVQFPVLPDFLGSSGSGMVPFSHVRIIDKLLEWKEWLQFRKPRLMAMGYLLR
jgi:hypothetical protein